MKVASNDGGYFCSCLVMKSGHFVRYPVLIDFARVSSVGGNSALCENSMCCAMVGASMKEFSACMFSCGALMVHSYHTFTFVN